MRKTTAVDQTFVVWIYVYIYIYFFFKREMTGRTSPNISHSFFCLSSVSGVGNTPQPQFCWAAASLQSIFIFQGLFKGRIEQRQCEWSLFYGYFTHAGLKIGSFQRVLLALNQPPLVGGIPAPALDRAMQEGNPLNAAAGQSSSPWDFQQKI